VRRLFNALKPAAPSPTDLPATLSLDIGLTTPNFPITYQRLDPRLPKIVLTAIDIVTPVPTNASR